MRAELKLKLAESKNKPRFKFVGIQKGVEVGDIYPLYNLILYGHSLHGSTVTYDTLKKRGLK